MEDTNDPSYHPDERELSSDDSSDVSNELSGTSDEDQPLIKRLKTTQGPKPTAAPTGRSAGRGKCIPEVEDKVSKRMAATQKGKGKRKGTGKRNTGKGSYSS
jgi:hypothetical protein